MLKIAYEEAWRNGVDEDTFFVERIAEFVRQADRNLEHFLDHFRACFKQSQPLTVMMSPAFASMGGAPGVWKRILPF